MTEHLTDERVDELLSFIAKSERGQGIDRETDQLHRNTLKAALTALRAERAAHQATRAELEAARRVADFVDVGRYRANMGVDSDITWHLDALAVRLKAYRAARAGQEGG